MLPDLVLYDYLHVRGGAEQFTLGLRDSLPNLRVTVAAVDPDVFPDSLRERVDLLDQAPIYHGVILRALHTVRKFLVYRPSRAPQCVLLSGHFAPLTIGEFEEPLTLVYLHSWPLHLVRAHDVVGASLIKQAAFYVFTRGYKYCWRYAIRRANLVLANSEELAKVAARDSGAEVKVVYPPINTDYSRSAQTGDAYLSFCRHEPQKRVQLLIESFRRMPNRKLKIASSGSQTEELKQLARGISNIEFVGDLDSVTLAKLIGSCRATLHVSRKEPFSMSILESLACGKPAIACSDSGAVVALGADNQTILPLPSDPEIEDIVLAVEQCEQLDAEAISKHALHRARDFSTPHFILKLSKLIDSVADEEGQDR